MITMMMMAQMMRVMTMNRLEGLALDICSDQKEGQGRTHFSSISTITERGEGGGRQNKHPNRSSVLH